MIVKSDGRRNSLPFFVVYLHVTFNIVTMIRKTTHNKHLGCLKGHWPVHLANKEILFGIIDDCLVSESFMFHCTEPECLMCWLEERFNCDDLVFYTINYLGSYCDIFLRFQFIDTDDPANNILDEVHLTCKTL